MPGLENCLKMYEWKKMEIGTKHFAQDFPFHFPYLMKKLVLSFSTFKQILQTTMCISFGCRYWNMNPRYNSCGILRAMKRNRKTNSRLHIKISLMLVVGMLTRFVFVDNFVWFFKYFCCELKRNTVCEKYQNYTNSISTNFRIGLFFSRSKKEN